MSELLQRKNKRGHALDVSRKKKGKNERERERERKRDGERESECGLDKI